MVDFPKHFNSKEDYLNMNAIAHEKMKPVFQEILSNRKEWFFVKEIEKANGINDDNHKVESMKNDDGIIIYRQYELRENPAADFFKYGFTEGEIRELLK